MIIGRSSMSTPAVRVAGSAAASVLLAGCAVSSPTSYLLAGAGLAGVGYVAKEVWRGLKLFGQALALYYPGDSQLKRQIETKEALMLPDVIKGGAATYSE